MTLNFLSRLTGCFAMPAAENPTVAMVEAAYRRHGLDIRYINCEVPPGSLGDAVKGARAMGWIGFNCSIPHKVAVIEHLDGLGESAAVMGAVNCAVRRGDKFIGENTDGKGFLQSLREVADPSGKTVVMFGAGGAARAIGVEHRFRRSKTDRRGQPQPRSWPQSRRSHQPQDEDERRTRRFAGRLPDSRGSRDRRQCDLGRALSER